MPYVVQNVRTREYHALDYGSTPDLARAFVFHTLPGADRNRYPSQEVLRVDVDAQGRPTNPQPVTGRN